MSTVKPSHKPHEYAGEYIINKFYHSHKEYKVQQNDLLTYIYIYIYI